MSASPRRRAQPHKERPAPELPLDAVDRAEFSTALLVWYRRNARDLPWRRELNPYRTWVSEIMLQQTRVNAVLEHFYAFTESFPTLVSLALAPEEQVLARWSGLGYYRRARLLHRAAKFVMEEFGGTLPQTAVELRKLPGIGNYTSAAIASIAFGERVAVVDGNVERVLLRVAGRHEQPDRATADLVAMFAQALIDAPAAYPDAPPPGDHNQAMMELGATVCTPRAPRCLECPVLDWCRTRGEHATPERPAMRSEQVCYALSTRNVGIRGGLQVLLHRRDSALSLMPDMLELPPLHAAPGSQPMLRLRHAIVGTNYYVEIFGLSNRREVRRRAQPGHNTAWYPAAALRSLPLTGLARKVLQRAGLMAAEAALPAAPRSPVETAHAEAVQPAAEAAQPQELGLAAMLPQPEIVEARRSGSKGVRKRLRSEAPMLFSLEPEAVG